MWQIIPSLGFSSDFHSGNKCERRGLVLMIRSTTSLIVFTDHTNFTLVCTVVAVALSSPDCSNYSDSCWRADWSDLVLQQVMLIREIRLVERKHFWKGICVALPSLHSSSLQSFQRYRRARKQWIMLLFKKSQPVWIIILTRRNADLFCFLNVEYIHHGLQKVDMYCLNDVKCNFLISSQTHKLASRLVSGHLRK